MKNTKRFKECLAAILVTAMIMSSLTLLIGCSADDSGGHLALYDADNAMVGQIQSDYGFERHTLFSYYDWSFDSAEALGAVAEDTTFDFHGGDVERARRETVPQTDGMSDNSVTPLLPVAGAAFAERIIHTAGAIIETMEFDYTIERINALLALNGGFIEHAYVGGRPMERGQPVFDNPNRRAEFTLRIPQLRMDDVTSAIDDLGNVLSLRRSAVNVTAQFIDTESRVTALRIQEERLLYMLGESTRIADMLDIERRVSDVRFEIERLTSSLMNLQNQVNFSTITLMILEVEEYTEPPEEDEEEEELTYWQQVRDGFDESARAVGGFFTGIFRWFVVNSPILVVIAVFAVPTVIIVKRKFGDRKWKKEMERNASAQKNKQPIESESTSEE